MLAACTATLSKRPSVSTRMWRLRPLIFLPASKPCGSLAAALLGGWDHGLDNPPFGVDQITWITKTAAVCCSKAVFRLPHWALPLRKFANQALNRITTDSSDSTTSWIGSYKFRLYRPGGDN